jgi:hypothetical protein
MQPEYNNLIQNENGQSIVEFVLLLVVVMTLSLVFLKFVNINLADQWKLFVTIIVDDPNIKLEL